MEGPHPWISGMCTCKKPEKKINRVATSSLNSYTFKYMTLYYVIARLESVTKMRNHPKIKKTTPPDYVEMWRRLGEYAYLTFG